MHRPGKMDWTFSKKKSKTLELVDEALKLFFSHYCSLQIFGIEHIPADGSVLLAPNHGGWATVDALLICKLVHDRFGIEAMPRFFIHDLWFRLPLYSRILRQAGAVPIFQGMRVPKEVRSSHRMWAMFPEGNYGICKPITKMYEIAEFQLGMIVLANQLKSVIVPVSVVGSEESFPVFNAISWFEKKLLTPLPVPLSPIPLPARWSIRFHPPVDLAVYSVQQLNDDEFCRDLCDRIRNTVQEGVDELMTTDPHKGFGPRATHRAIQCAQVAHKKMASMGLI